MNLRPSQPEPTLSTQPARRDTWRYRTVGGGTVTVIADWETADADRATNTALGYGPDSAYTKSLDCNGCGWPSYPPLYLQVAKEKAQAHAETCRAIPEQEADR